MTDRKQFVLDRQVGGGFKTRLAVAGVALAELYCTADLGNRKTLLNQTLDTVRDYAREVLGWNAQECEDMVEEIRKSVTRR